MVFNIGVYVSYDTHAEITFVFCFFHLQKLGISLSNQNNYIKISCRIPELNEFLIVEELIECPSGIPLF